MAKRIGDLFRKTEQKLRNQEAADRRIGKRQGGDRKSLDFKEYNNKKDIPFENSLIKKGTSREASIRRLKTSRPDLYAQCLAGELTANAAMIEAGLRKKPKC